MISNTITLLVDIFLLIICTFQVLANLIVLIAFGGDAKLRRNPNLILLASLAFIDFAYALLSIPYLIILITFWVPEGEEFNYNAVMVIHSGAMPAALMKSGCTITTLIALDRVIALFFPTHYFKLDRKKYFIGGFILSLLMALFDLTVLFRLTHIHAVPGCTSFDCFTSTVLLLIKLPGLPGLARLSNVCNVAGHNARVSVRTVLALIDTTPLARRAGQKFRAYWGLSNMVVNTISCILTIALVIGLKRLRANRQEHLSRVRQAARDKSADRVAMYILIISAVFGVIPGTINGCAEFTHIVLLNDIGFFIGVCASISGLSHAFIFGMAHPGIRNKILVMFGMKAPASATAVSTVVRTHHKSTHAGTRIECLKFNHTSNSS